MDPSSSPLRVVEHSPSYWTVVIDNPPLNLFDPETHAALRLVLDRAEENDKLRVLVVESAVEGYFIAHFDMVRGREVPDIPGAAPITEWAQTVHRLVEAPFISIASVRGRARGHGSKFVLACDLRYASREMAVFGQPELGVGGIPGGGGLQWLPLLVGRSRAIEIAVGGDDYDAETAERYGWITRAIPDAELDSFVDAFARRVAGFGRDQIATIKKTLSPERLVASAGGILHAQQEFRRLIVTPESQERITALVARGFQQPGETEWHLGHEIAQVLERG